MFLCAYFGNACLAELDILLHAAAILSFLPVSTVVQVYAMHI